MELKKFSYIFLTILGIHILTTSITDTDWVLYITKPAIVLSLFVYFCYDGFAALKTFQKVFLIGLLFSLIKDILLIEKSLFIYGLAFSFMAQIAYSLTFYMSVADKKGWLSKKPLLLLVILIYPAGLLFFLWPYLQDSLMPVMTYTFVLTVMFALAINRFKNVSNQNFLLVISGAFFFILSDSILAIQKFIQDYFLGSLFIMLTYGISQYLLTVGIKRAE